jgi:hypothetical protein
MPLFINFKKQREKRMKKFILVLILILFFLANSISQEQEKSPIEYKGIEAWMSPEEVKEILGGPIKELIQKDDLILFYSFSDGEKCELTFAKGKWLTETKIMFSKALSCTEFGLKETGVQYKGFMIDTDKEGNKRWNKIIKSEKWGIGMISYRAKENSSKLIDTKFMFVSSPLLSKYLVKKESRKTKKLPSFDEAFNPIEESPMQYKGVDAGMSPQQVIKILGKPLDQDKKRGELRYFYSLPGGGSFALAFYREKWLYFIVVRFPTSFNYSEFGLTEEGGEGFETYINDDGLKIWRKIINTEKFGKIRIIYQTEAGYQTLINTKIMQVLDPSLVEK